MSLFKSLRGLFSDAPSPPKLRNKPGGMAWVKGLDQGDGSEVLNGSAVRTVRLSIRGFWVIDPPLQFVVSHDCYYTVAKIRANRGDRGCITAIADECLEPWRDIGDSEQDESTRWLPPVPTKSKETA